MEIAELGFAVDSTPIARARDELGRFLPAAQKAENATDKLNNEFVKGSGAATRFTTSMSATTSQLKSLVGMVKNFAGGFAAAFGIHQLIEITNTWTDLSSRVEIAVGSMELATATMDRLQQMARRTYSGLGQTAESFLLNARALTELGYATEKQLDFTEGLNNALVVSGSKGDRAASVMNAISKAMAGGKLRGEELNTVIQSGGRVAQALAEGMGVATTDLRALGEQGKITSDVLFKSIISQLDKLREEADGMPATIGDAFVIMGNSIVGFIGKLDQATGASSRIAEVIIFVADNLQTVADIIVVAGAALLTAFGPSVIAMISGGLVGAIRAVGEAVLANPLGALAVALVTITTAVWTFRDAIKDAIGVDVEAIVKGTANNIIRFFLHAFENVKEIWSTLPGVIGNAAIGAANFVIDAINNMIVNARMQLNMLIAQVKQLPFVGEGINMLDPNEGKITKLNEIATGAWDAALINDVNNAIIANTDYVGQLTGAYTDLTAATDTAALATDGVGGAMNNAAGGGAQKLKDGLKAIQEQAEATQKRMEEIRDTLTDLVGGAIKSFFADIREGVSAVDALSNAFGKLADKLMDMVLDQAINGFINMLMGTMFGGGLGTGKGLTGAATFGFTGKGVYGVPGLAAGGVVTKPTMIMAGEGGDAEAVLPLQRGANGKLGVTAVANDNGATNVIYLQPIIHNNAADQVEATTGTDDAGNLVVMIDRVTAGLMGQPGSKLNKATRSRLGAQNAVRSR